MSNKSAFLYWSVNIFRLLRRKLSLVFILAILLNFFPALAQNSWKLSGTVTDGTTGEFLMGVNVSIKGTLAGTVTDMEGTFSLDIKSGDVLVFSYIGYLTREFIIEDETYLAVVLAEDAEQLEEVVVVGYGVMKKSDVTGSIVSVREEDLTSIPATNALEVLQGKVAGLDLIRSSGQTGAGLEILIRGERSLREGLNDPLIIVDGVDYGTDLDISPNEIQSIEVLKDASSTAIYGSRGANGVIIITTKRGEGQSKVSFNAYYGSMKAVDYPDFFLGQDFVDFAREAHLTSGAWSDSTDDDRALDPYELFDGEHYINWRDHLIHDGLTENYELFVSGGNEKTTFSLSDYYTHEKGIFKMDDFKRYGGKINVDHQISKYARTGVNVAYTYTDREKRVNPLNLANKMVPVGEPYLEDGSINIYPLNDGSILGPLVDEIPGAWTDDEITKRIHYNTYLELVFFKDLKFRSALGVDITDRNEGIFADENTIRNNGGYNSASIFNFNRTYIQLENTLSYNKDLGIHQLQFLLGNTINNETKTSSRSEGSNFPTNTFLYHNMAGAQSEILNRSSYARSQMVSFFGRAHYSLKNKYIFQATLRGDGASTLAEGYKWAAFPSASVAWRVGEESFMENISSIDGLKLRLSYGTSGKRSFDPYVTQGVYAQSVYTWEGDELASGYFPFTISNDSLRWETTATTDLGVDLRMFRNRINLTVDVYRQFTYYLLMDRQLPPNTGYTSILENIGETENKGMEVTLSTQNVKANAGFSWTTDLSFFFNKERILKLNQSERDINNLWFTGYPSKVFYSQQKVGIWQSSDSLLAASYGFRPGDIRLEDFNKDGVISDADRVIVGQRRPKWSGGLNNRFTYKGFDLNVFIYARMGQTIDYEGYHWDSYWYEGRASGVMVDYWTYSNPTNEFPRPDRGAKQKAFNETLRYVDGSFIKIRDINLGYSLPASLLNRLGIAKCRVYTTMKNYFPLYNTIPGYDSERGGDLSFPMTKQWLVGVNVDF